MPNRTLRLSSCVHRDDPRGIDAAYAQALDRIDELRAAVEGAPPPHVPSLHGDAVEVAGYEPLANLSREDFKDRVRRALDYILAGDIFQVQVSRRFALPLRAHPFDVYVALRAINPSPYMIYIATPECTLVGASPEMLVQVTGREVRYHPIAGTRRRGRTPEDDARMEAELRASEKEAAEHLMLIDLGRNDLGRVSETGSVRVTQHMEVERYSHVMHLVSSIEGTLDEGHGPLDALRSCFPAGTVTGAPKIRAMEIIAELEPEVRGPYAGAIGYVGYGGDLDTAIALRTIVVRDGIAYVQAAAGIVADSSAHEEALEIDNKVAAQILAVEEANAWAQLSGQVLVIDNYDSFTFNLVQYLRELGAVVAVERNDSLTRRRGGATRIRPRSSSRRGRAPRRKRGSASIWCAPLGALGPDPRRVPRTPGDRRRVRRHRRTGTRCRARQGRSRASHGRRDPAGARQSLHGNAISLAGHRAGRAPRTRSRSPRGAMTGLIMAVRHRELRGRGRPVPPGIDRHAGRPRAARATSSRPPVSDSSAVTA